MIQLHATRKLFEVLPLNAQGQLAATPRSQWLFERTSPDFNPLSGWHGHLVTLQRRNCVFFIHNTTRFSLVLPALTKPDFAELNDHFVDSFMNTLLKCGAEDNHMTAAHTYLRPLQFNTQCNRSVQGTLNRAKGDVEHSLWYNQTKIAELSGYRLGAWLADRPCTVNGKTVIWPQKEMLMLLSQLANNGVDMEAQC
ncbi:MAG: hypothetical protein B0W54_06825 [Cellvibrio sp. 79]|nr:MAG: hypothetical protein B0W54_06825 [Cellvibrio sp. 79]